MKELIRLITLREGKKVEVSIGNVKELLKVLADILANDPEMYTVFKHYVQGKQKHTIEKRKTDRELKQKES